jgi:hypothetical protein
LHVQFTTRLSLDRTRLQAKVDGLEHVHERVGLYVTDTPCNRHVLTTPCVFVR